MPWSKKDSLIDKAMVVGVGIDMVFIPRIEQALKRWGSHFLDKIFTKTEQEECMKRADPAHCLAIRFAAKEACSKARGTGMRKGISWCQMGIETEPTGRPVLHLSGAALLRAKKLGATSWMVSLSHERDYATAIVILNG